MYEQNYEMLADAIIVQAAKDYRRSKSVSVRNEIKCFFLSEWFACCLDKGYTTSTCTMCGLNYVSDYTEPTSHNWDEGHTVTNSTCDAEGVIEYQ